MAAIVPQMSQSIRTCLHQRQSQLQRTFTSSSTRRTHGPLSVFSPTSSAELDTLLSIWRNKIFMPAHLLEAQRRLIYQPTKHHFITGEEPVVLQVRVKGPGTDPDATEPFTLSPLDQLRDEPGTRQSFDRLLALLQTPADWTILPDFLAELRTSRRKVTPVMAMKLIRAASRARRLEPALVCMRAVERTGVRLDNVAVVTQATWAVLRVLILQKWSEPAFAKAAKQADDLAFLIRDPSHAVIKGTEAKHDPARRPELLGTSLALGAMRALQLGGQSKPQQQQEQEQEKGKETESKAETRKQDRAQTTDLIRRVESTARRILALRKHAVLELETDGWASANHALLICAPLDLGLRKAVELLGPASPLGQELLDLRVKDVAPFLLRAEARVLEVRIEGMGKSPPMGLDLFRELKSL